MMAYMIIAGLIGFVIDKGMLLVESILLKWKVDLYFMIEGADI